MTVIAELGDLTRFDNPRQLAAFVGLVPSEHSSGEQRRQGPITKAGNSRARRALVEGAWAYRHPAKISEIPKPSTIATGIWTNSKLSKKPLPNRHPVCRPVSKVPTTNAHAAQRTGGSAAPNGAHRERCGTVSADKRYHG